MTTLASIAITNPLLTDGLLWVLLAIVLMGVAVIACDLFWRGPK